MRVWIIILYCTASTLVYGQGAEHYLQLSYDSLDASATVYEQQGAFAESLPLRQAQVEKSILERGERDTMVIKYMDNVALCYFRTCLKI